MGHRFAGGEAERAVADDAAEQHRKAVERALRLGEEGVERVEPAAMAVGERVEAGVEAGEGLTVRGEDEEIVGELLQPGDRGQPFRPSGSASGSLRLSDTFEVIRGST